MIYQRQSCKRHYQIYQRFLRKPQLHRHMKRRQQSNGILRILVKLCHIWQEIYIVQLQDDVVLPTLATSCSVILRLHEVICHPIQTFDASDSETRF